MLAGSALKSCTGGHIGWQSLTTNREQALRFVVSSCWLECCEAVGVTEEMSRVVLQQLAVRLTTARSLTAEAEVA
jgi:hypothetical protein